MAERQTQASPELPLPLIDPMKPVEVSQPPKDLVHWIAEPKFNGMRAIVYIHKSGRIEIRTKTSRNVTENFRELEDGFKALGEKHSIILDGEIIYGHGKTPQERMAVTAKPSTDIKPIWIAGPEVFSFVAFDLLCLDGVSLLDTPLIKRKPKLKRVLSKSKAGDFNIIPVDFVSGKRNQTIFVKRLEEEGFEGAVFKRLDGRYSARFPHNWLKLKFGHSPR